MRARNIKPSFFLNDDLAEIDPMGRLLFIGLWMMADREGRLEDRPKRIKGTIFPYDNVEVDALLDDLQRWGFIKRYEANGIRCIAVVNFKKHQTPHIKETESVLPAYEDSHSEKQPAPTLHSASTIQAPDLHQTSTNLAQCQHPLNPESLILNPESITHTTREAEPVDNFIVQPNVCVEEKVKVSILFNKNGIRCQSNHPHIVALAEQGVSHDTILAAIAKARERKKNPSLEYVLGVLRNWTENPADFRGASPPKKEQAWWTDERSIIRKGEELGVHAMPGEEMFQYKARIQQAIEARSRLQ